jgi:Ca-activated chloride channel family protein
MIFERPSVLLLLYALIPMLILMTVNYKLRFARIYSLAASASAIFYDDINAAVKRKPSVPLIRAGLCLRYILSCLFFIIFFVCMCAALAGPRFGVHYVRELRQGADIVLAFDLSRSMNVRDAAPLPYSAAWNAARNMGTAGIRGALSSSRLERSIYTARILLENLISSDGDFKNIRLGAALGKGEAVLAVPLTGDPEAIFALLNSITSLALTSRGTNLEKILDAASKAFQDGFPVSRSIVLFSDGESLTGSLTAAIERLRRRDIKVFTIGAGSVYGAVVPDAGSFESVNSTGKKAPITSYLRPDILESIAEWTGGAYIDGDLDSAAVQLAVKINSNSTPSDENGAWTLREESGVQWHIFVIAGLISLIFSKLCSLRFKHPATRHPPVGFSYATR